jgi:3-deoxy-7-phosphoheptulonate synthase
VLRGGANGPNYDADAVAKAAQQLSAAKTNAGMIVDVSHDNSGKNYERQPEVAEAVAQQIADGQRNIIGLMIESHLVAGKQSASKPGVELRYGQSITDACVDLSTTEVMLEKLAAAVRERRKKAVRA